MIKKTDLQDLDYPIDDAEAWNRYPKHRWVYELTRLLDAQGVKWLPYYEAGLPNKVANIQFQSVTDVVYEPGMIYTKLPDGDKVITEVHIIKGEIKNIRHFDSVTTEELTAIIGEIDLRVNAFVTLHFQKFTGVLSLNTIANEIVRIRLRPHVVPAREANTDVIKLLKRIYKKSDNHINGSTNRDLREALTS